MNGQVSVNSDLSVYKRRRGKFPSLTLKPCIRHSNPSVLVHNWDKNRPLYTLNQVSEVLVVIIFGAEVFVTVAWHVLLEEASQVFQAFFLALLEVAAHNDDRPVGEVASSTAIFPEADIAV